MQVYHHVGSAVVDFGVGMSRQIVGKFGEILGGFVGGLGLVRLDCADGQNNDSINCASIVEFGANYFLNVIDASWDKSLVEFWGRS